MGTLQRMMVRDFPYWDINQSAWFVDISENCKEARRSNNRIYIYFNSKDEAEKCIQKCEERNISQMGIMEDTFYKTFRVDILMNWKERRPSRAKRNKAQILD